MWLFLFQCFQNFTGLVISRDRFTPVFKHVGELKAWRQCLTMYISNTVHKPMKRTKSKSVYRKFVVLVRQAAYFCDCVWPCILIETLKTPLQGYNKLCMNINPHFIGSNCIYLKVCLCMPLHSCELVPVNRHSICVSMCACMHACGFHHT